MFDLNDIDALSVYVDGADEINASRDARSRGRRPPDPREKIVAAVADQFICIIDNTKTVDVLGTFPAGGSDPHGPQDTWPARSAPWRQPGVA